ncbi:MAG: hypothetical protein JST00_39030 [Deltaproteobacteria bacterium]|nr:hypothetical protein [Deltaproteobacteria bacterium]
MERGEAHEIPAVVVERNRLCGGLAVVGLLAAPLLLVATAPTWETLVNLAVIIGSVPLIPLLGWLLYHAPRRTEATVRASDDGLVVTTPRGTQRLPREEFRGGTAYLAASGAHVVDLTRWRHLGMRLEVQRDGHARAILDAAGVDRRLGTTRFPVQIRSKRTTWTGVVGIALVALAQFLVPIPELAVALLGFVAAAGIGLAWLSTRATLTVGTDGLALEPLLGRRRFVAHEAIMHVDTIPAPHDKIVSPGFVVTRRDGVDVFDLDTREARFRGGVWRSDPVHEAARNAWWAALGRRPGASSPVVHELAPGEASTKEWVAKLRALGAGQRAADYRAPALEDQALFDVVADPNVDAELRAAAAVALGASEAHAPRLRIAVDDLADERIRRVALAAIEEENDAAVEEEMEELRQRRRQSP